MLSLFVLGACDSVLRIPKAGVCHRGIYCVNVYNEDSHVFSDWCEVKIVETPSKLLCLVLFCWSPVPVYFVIIFVHLAWYCSLLTCHALGHWLLGLSLGFLKQEKGEV